MPRTISGWDGPEIDEPMTKRLIVKALHQALDEPVQEAVPAIRA
jgi:hypothetical protein